MRKLRRNWESRSWIFIGTVTMRSGSLIGSSRIVWVVFYTTSTTALPPPSLAPIHSWKPRPSVIQGSPSSPLGLWKESRPHAHKPPLYENLRQQPQHFKKGAPQTGLPCTMKLSGIVAEVFFFLAMYACELLSVEALDSACQSPLLGPRSKPGGGFKLSMLEEPCT